MIWQKTYYFYHQPKYNRTQQKKIRNMKNDILLSKGSYQTNSTSNINLINFPCIKSRNNNNKLERSNSSKNNIYYKFYKLLKKFPLTPKHKLNLLNDNILSTSPFYFGTQNDQDEILKKINIINKGNHKHQMLTNIETKKENQKKKSAKQFMKEMKLVKINLKLINKKNIEERKIKHELINLSKNKLRRTRSLCTNISSNKKNRNSNIHIKINNIMNNERKLVIHKDKLMHRFYEIMKNFKEKK